MKRLTYIDPQSSNNLSSYDRGILENLKDYHIDFFGSDKWDQDLIDNCEMNLWFNYQNVTNPILKGLSYVKTIFRIINRLKSNPPDVVHIQWLKVWPVDKFFLNFLKKRKIKTVFTAHNILPHNSGSKYIKKYKWYYNKVDAIIVHSEKTRDELEKAFQISHKKIHVIRHGIIKSNIDEEQLKQRRETLINKYNFVDKIVFASLGYQSYYKGSDILAQVWMNTPQLRDNQYLQLMIVGKNQGVDFKQLSKCKNVIIIDEKVSNLDFEAFLSLSTVVVLPYRQISQSGVLFSALNQNIPVLVSDAGGLSEPLKYGNVGWCLGESNFTNLKVSLLSIIEDSSRIYRLYENKEEFEKVKCEYSWIKISNHTEKLYDLLINAVNEYGN